MLKNGIIQLPALALTSLFLDLTDLDTNLAKPSPVGLS